MDPGRSTPGLWGALLRLLLHPVLLCTALGHQGRPLCRRCGTDVRHPFWRWWRAGVVLGTGAFGVLVFSLGALAWLPDGGAVAFVGGLLGLVSMLGGLFALRHATRHTDWSPPGEG